MLPDRVMPRPRIPDRTLRAALLIGLASGCTGLETDGPAIGADQDEASAPCPGQPRREAVAPDVLAGFFPCCDGSAHLLPRHLVPVEFHGMLEPGRNDTLCVPDALSADPGYTPRACTSVFGLAGACLSSCLPQVRDAAVPLPRDVCQGNQLCAPCINPQTDQPTGACGLGAMACAPAERPGPCRDFAPTLDVSRYPACGVRAHCAPGALVEADQRAELARCPDGQSYCVPDDFLQRGGRYTPPRCASIGGREGRCLSLALPRVAADQARLPVATCNPADERCVPCYDPRTGADTGACSKGHCDPGPSEGPRVFQPCGGHGEDASCIPAELVPEADRARFDALGCLPAPCAEPGTLCVPGKIIDAGPSYSPRACRNPLTSFIAAFLEFFRDPIRAIAAIREYGEGRCLSRCLPQVRPNAALLGRHGCDEDEICVPCLDPQRVAEGRVPTGACDR